MEKHDILIIGSICGVDVIMAEHLARHGMSPVVLRRVAKGRAMELPKDYLRAFSPDRIIVVKRPAEFILQARRSKLILSFNGALLEFLRAWWPARRLLGLAPVINCCTGADMTELAAESSLKATLYRQYLRFADLNWCLPLPHALKNAVALKLKNVVFMNGFPYPNIAVPPSPAGSLPHQPGKLKLFHCSNFDWNYTNFGSQRNSVKGNDRFLRAFIRLVQQGLNVECTFLDRGPDREVARRMIEEAGVMGATRWFENLTRDQLYTEMREADIIVNMFAHGGAGGISFEGMAIGRPVMQFANPTYFRLNFGGDLPPFINCRTEEQICQQLRWYSENSAHLNLIAEQGLAWVHKHISWETSLDKFLFYYSLLTGARRIDYGPLIEDMEEHVAQVVGGEYDPFAGLAYQRDPRREIPVGQDG